MTRFPERRRTILRRIVLRIAVPVAAAAALAACSDGDGGTAAPPPAAETRYGAYLAARHADAREDAAQAAVLHERALAADPSNPLLIERTFSALVSAGRLAEAVPLAEKLSAEKRLETRALMLLAVHAARNRDFETARSRLDDIGEQDVLRLLRPMLLAWVEQGAGRFDIAVREINRLDGIEQFAPFFSLHKALLHDVEGRAEEAGRLFDAAYGAQTLPPLRVVQAVVSFHVRNGNRERAVEILEEMLAVSPESSSLQVMLDHLRNDGAVQPVAGSATDGMSEALINLTGALLHADRTGESVFYGRLAAWLRPGDDSTLLMLGEVFERTERHGDAVTVYRAVPADSAFSWSARRSVVANLAALERYDEAVELLEEMAGERTERWDALALLGDLYRSRKMWTEAVAAYDRAIERVREIENHHWQLFYSSGIALERSKDWERAEKALEQALELRPDEPYLLNYLAYSWVDRGENLAEAQKMLQRAVELRPRDGYIIDSLGWVFYRLGAFDKAVPLLERAVELQPGDPVINDHLGDAYWRVGRELEARFQWRRALSFEPEKEEIPKIEDKIQNGLPPFEPVRPEDR